MLKKSLLIFLSAVVLVLSSHAAMAEDYIIDSKNAHAFIQFKISHLGYSWILGRFNRFVGTFSYDEKNPQASKVKVTVDTTSVDTNNAERDKHLRSEKFFEVKKYTEAVFVSRAYEPKGDDTAVLKGDFTLHGVTRPMEIKVKHIGAGKDPWGGFRRGFEGSAKLALSDYNINTNLGPASKEVELFLSIEGIKK
ncbi:MAG: YceI family protein [Deltaproteobacteria bacterium]|nr:YceI family protein [Deltaproteobacteria bacterium]